MKTSHAFAFVGVVLLGAGVAAHAVRKALTPDLDWETFIAAAGEESANEKSEAERLEAKLRHEIELEDIAREKAALYMYEGYERGDEDGNPAAIR